MGFAEHEVDGTVLFCQAPGTASACNFIRRAPAEPRSKPLNETSELICNLEKEGERALERSARADRSKARSMIQVGSGTVENVREKQGFAQSTVEDFAEPQLPDELFMKIAVDAARCSKNTDNATAYHHLPNGVASIFRRQTGEEDKN